MSRNCLAASFTCILRSFSTSDGRQEMRLPLQMLIILRAVNNVSVQLELHLRCKDPSALPFLGGKRFKGRKATGREVRGSAWLCLFCVSLSPREVLAAPRLTVAFGSQIHLAQPCPQVTMTLRHSIL